MRGKDEAQLSRGGDSRPVGDMSNLWSHSKVEGRQCTFNEKNKREEELEEVSFMSHSLTALAYTIEDYGGTIHK